MEAHQNVFVVGTGRCGSTMLSNMFRQSENLLSISEFFAFTTDLGTLIQESFPQGKVKADYFWKLISHPHAKQNLMLREGVAMKEVLYEVTNDSRFNFDTGVPAIMQTTLPHITDEADRLFHELKDYILSLPDGSIAYFYKQLFDWLKDYHHKKIWVERTGGSLRIVHRLYDLFPEAKFIHIVRDGRECAMSMEKHYGFRMVMIVFQLLEILGVDPFVDDDREWLHDLPDEIACFLPENFDADAFKNYEVSPSLYGHYWSGEIALGLKEMEKIPEDQKIMVRYEDILEAPQKSMQRIASFIGDDLTSAHWVEQCAAQIRSPHSRFEDLSVHEQKLLNDACKPGFEALRAAGVDFS